MGYASTTHRFVVPRAVAAALLTICAAVVLVLPLTGPVRTSVQLLATYALKGTLNPLYNPSDEEVREVATKYVSGTYGNPPLPVNVVNYPASLRPISPPDYLFGPTFNQSVAMGLAELQRISAGDSAPVIFGYSQGAVVSTEYKKAFNQQYATPAPGTAVPQPTFVLIGNADRPNEGLLARLPGLYLPILDLTFNGPTPTHTAGAAPGQITTYDISGQYDFFSDFPNYPLNVLSLANAALGVYFVHANYENRDPAEAIFQDQVGDTAYYLLPTARLPLLMPLAVLGVPDPLLAILDAPLRVLVEAGYDRIISPGQPTTASLLPIANPLQTAANLVVAIPTGVDDGLQQLGLGRPLGTTAAGPYGVGGPPVTLPGNSTSPLTTAPSLEGFSTPTPTSQVLAGTSSRQQPDSVQSSPSNRPSATARTTPTIGRPVPKTEETQNIVRGSLNFSPTATNSTSGETPNRSSTATTVTTEEPVTPSRIDTTPSTGASNTTGTDTDATAGASTQGGGQSANSAAA